MARNFTGGGATIAALLALLTPLALPTAATATPIGSGLLANTAHSFHWSSGGDDNSGWSWGSWGNSSDDNSGWNWGNWGGGDDNNGGGWCSPVQYTWANICGQILCGKDADTVSCATVSLVDSNGKVVCTTQSDSCGNYNFCEWLPVGKYTVSACKTPDYITASSGSFSVSDWNTCCENVTLTAQAAVFAAPQGLTGSVFFFPDSTVKAGANTLNLADLFTTQYQSTTSIVYYPYIGTIPNFPQYTQCNPFVGEVVILEPLVSQTQINANAEAAIDEVQAGQNVTSFTTFYDMVSVLDDSTNNYTIRALFDHPNAGPTNAYSYELTKTYTDAGLPVSFVDDSTYLINLSSGCYSPIECQPFSVPVCDMVQTMVNYQQPRHTTIHLYVSGTYTDICHTPYPFNLCPVVTTP